MRQALLQGGFENVGYDGVSLFDDAHPLINSAKLVTTLFRAH